MSLTTDERLDIAAKKVVSIALRELRHAREVRNLIKMVRNVGSDADKVHLIGILKAGQPACVPDIMTKVSEKLQ